MFPLSFHFACKTVVTIRHLPSMTMWRNVSAAINITSRNAHCCSGHMPFRVPLLFRSGNQLGVRNISQEYKKRTAESEKDLLLFTYENPTFYKWLNLCGGSMFIFWTYMSSEFRAMSVTDKIPQSSREDSLPWYFKFNIRSDLFRSITGTLCLFIGCAFLAFSWMYSLRSVRLLVLRKGGERVSIVTYGPFLRNRVEEFALKDVSCRGSRSAKSDTIPIKVRGKWPFYLLHSKGEYRNVMLFDRTVGYYRGF